MPSWVGSVSACCGSDRAARGPGLPHMLGDIGNLVVPQPDVSSLRQCWKLRISSMEQRRWLSRRSSSLQRLG